MNRTSVQTRCLDNFEELNAAVQGARSEVVQLDPGRVSGYISHMSIDGLPVNVGAFSLGVRSRGVLSNDRITIGMLTSTNDRVTHWSREMHVGDVLVTPPGVEYGGRYYGGASFATISLAHSDIVASFGNEPEICDPVTWQKNHFRAVPDPAFIPRVVEILQNTTKMHATLTDDAVRFWRRAIIEVMTAPVLQNMPADDEGALPSASRIFQEVEHYIDGRAATPVHVSQVCSRLKLSRRSLHRAFHDSVGIGPVTFLRRKRLCAVHSTLLGSDSEITTIAEVAMQHGFVNLGRFSGYYRAMFGEYPSQTLAKPARLKHAADRRAA